MRKEVILAVSSLMFAAGARADFATPTDWTRPTDDANAQANLTTYQEWNVFTSPGGPNNPDVGEVNPNPGVSVPNASKANFYDTSGQSFVTGGGNIYSPTAVTLLHADVPSYGLGAGFNTFVEFQLRSLGAEADYNTVRVTYSDGTDHTVFAASRTELARVALGGFGGDQVDSLFRFTLPYSPAQFKLEFDASGDSLSTDRAAIDTLTAPVPEPTSLGLLGMAGAALLTRRRKASH